MSTAAIERYALRAAPTVGPAVALAGLTTLLFVRLVPDVSTKPLHEDEAVAGLIAARPLGEVVQTVVLDRGGAPLHFVLAHFTLALDVSPEALRWLSVVFALATVPLCYDLARRLAGPVAGVTAAALAATSQLLTIYGTFGRMYSLFAFASALATDLFVRALERPGRRTALVAAAAALFPIAVHPFGAFLVAAELAVAVWLWRGRKLRVAFPVIGVGVLALPLLFMNVRLSGRYAIESKHDLELSAFLHALGGAAGGHGVVLIVFAVLGVIGLFAVRRVVAAFVVLAFAIPPLALAIVATAGDRLSPRHLIFTLPRWSALVAVGGSRVAARLHPKSRAAVLVLVVLAAVLAPSAISDPRTVDRAVAAPAAQLRAQLSPGDVLYPYSPVFLAALPDAAEARGYPREPVALARAAARTRNVHAVFVSVPAGNSWSILEQRGPFRDGRAVLTAVVQMLLRAPADPYKEQIRGAACAALIRLGSGCQPVATSTDGTSPQRSSSR